MTIAAFNDKVLTSFTEEITDLVFMYILNNNELMDEYLDLISEHSRQDVNCQLGLRVKEWFNLENIAQDGEPKCVLIKTKYTRHRK